MHWKCTQLIDTDGMQLLYCYIKRHVTKLMRFMLLKCDTLGLLRPVTNVSYRPECGVYFSRACLSR